VLFTDGLSGTLAADGTGEKGEEIVLAEVAADRGRTSAEIVAGTLLAGEISIIAAISAGHFARSHERLGRVAKT
jgi:hydroxymethylglutaryl-CoA reductase